MRYLLLAALLLALFVVQTSHASYIVTAINTTVSLNQNTSAQVVQVIKVAVTNTSVAQYTADRLALNLTLSQWQALIGPQLIENIINPRGSVYNFDFLPGPLIDTNNGKVAYLVLTYTASNVTTKNQTGPRTINYRFDDAAFNFQNARSGPVLGDNTTLNILLPQGAHISKVSPNPDYPAYAFSTDYRNVTSLTWDSDESLSQFTLAYTMEESLQDEVLTFFTGIYNDLGSSIALAIIIIAIAAFIIYTYLKVGR